MLRGVGERRASGARSGWRMRGWHSVCWAAVLVLLPVVPLATIGANAQTTDPPVGSRLRVANTEGQRLNLRAGPGTSEAVLARQDEGAIIEVVGTARAIAGARWIEVRAPGGQRGWISLAYAAVVSTPAPAATPTPRVTPTPVSDADERTTSVLPPVAPGAEATATPGLPVDIEAKVKFPETSGRDQEITVWVTRGGAPVPGALVTAVNEDGDDDEPQEREFDPTDAEGRARRSFSIRRDKGTVRVVLEAVAPDGGKGETTMEYFRR